MFTTLVAVVCSVLTTQTPVCAEEIVTDSSMSEITMLACQLHGQIGIAHWQSSHPLYHSWKVQGWKCVNGHYNVHNRV